MPKFLGRKVFGLLFVTLCLSLTMMLPLRVRAGLEEIVGESGADDGYILENGARDSDDYSIIMISTIAKCYNWFRFRVEVPYAALITSAKLYLVPWGYTQHDEVPPYIIRAFDEDEASIPVDLADFQSRPKTDAYQNWSLNDWGGGMQVGSPDIRHVIQEIVDRDGWNSGNHIVICTSVESSALSSRKCHSYEYAHQDGYLSWSPALVVYWTEVVRDVAVTSVTPTPTEVEPGEPVSISVTVKNDRDPPPYGLGETFNVTAYYGIYHKPTKYNIFGSYEWHDIETRKVTNLAPNSSTTLDFDWDTNGLAERNYYIKAEATEVPGETTPNSVDNTYIYDGTVTVELPKPPQASFTYSPETPLVDEIVTFTSTSSDPDGTISTYEWNFGDGDTSMGSVTTHAYTANDTYTVTLTVTDNDGLTDTATRDITVFPPELDRPIANFTYSPESPVVDQTVTFNASISSDTDGYIVRYEWGFGDGETADETDPISTYAYNASGEFSVTLRVTDNDGLSNATTQSISVGKRSSSITASVSATSFTVGGNTTITGYLSPAREGVNVTIQYSLSGGEWTNLTTVTTGSDGGYSYTWTPTTAGTYEVKASWEGDEAATFSESPLQTLAVQPPTYTLTITVDPAAGGETDPAAGVHTYTAGEEVPVTVTPATGYEFDYWELDEVNVGEETTYTVTMNADHTLSAIVKEQPPAFPWELLIAGLVGIAVVGAVLVWLWKRRKPKEEAPGPSSIRVVAEPTELLADGKSRSIVTIQLLDREGKPVAASTDTKVKLATTGGQIESPLVKIPKGKDVGKTVLLSSTESGKIELSAKAKGLKRITTELLFVEKERFCMGCGARISVKDKRCKKCGASPDQFTGPARICKNCERRGKKTYIPQTAEFCSECGASQPRQGE